MRRPSLSLLALVPLALLSLVLVALPAAVLIEESLHSAIGASRVDESLRQGLDLSWLGEYSSRARGLETTVRASLVGRGAVFDNLESWFSGELFLDLRTVAFGGAYALSDTVDVAFLVPFAAGNFIYIGASDLVPEVKTHQDLKTISIHLLAFILGVALLVVVA